MTSLRHGQNQKRHLQATKSGSYKYEEWPKNNGFDPAIGIQAERNDGVKNQIHLTNDRQRKQAPCYWETASTMTVNR